MELEFWVTICLGHGDGGDVSVTAEVTDDEYELLKQCCREDEEIESFDGLEDLYERIIEAAREESEACESDDEVGIDYDDATYTVNMPDEIYDALEEDDADEFRDLLDQHRDDRFAIETLGWEILSFAPDFQKEVLEKLLAEYEMSETVAVDCFSNPSAAPKFFFEKMHAIGASSNGIELVLESRCGKMGNDLHGLIDSLGWRQAFEGERSKFETVGVFYIE